MLWYIIFKQNISLSFQRDVIDVIDSEDEEIQEAIENSLLDIEM